MLNRWCARRCPLRRQTPVIGTVSRAKQPLAATQPENISLPRGLRGPHRHDSARDRVRRRKVRRELGAPDDWAWVIIAAAVLGTTVLMSMIVFFSLQAAQGLGSKTVVTAGPALEPTSVLYGPGGILEGVVGSSSAGRYARNGESMVIQPWDGQERFTVLVMGMDLRPGEFGASVRTDTMILISLDPTTDRVGILSIPRDLFVEIPGYGLQRINTAFQAGELEGLVGDRAWRCRPCSTTSASASMSTCWSISIRLWA